MSADVKTLEQKCRHEKYGRCRNHFWNVMKKSGKPGLAEFACILWKAKMEALSDYHDAAWRVRCFGLKGEARERAIAKLLDRKPSRQVSCPDFKPISSFSPIECRYYYMETCVRKYPLCHGRCPEYLPQGDQRS